MKSVQPLLNGSLSRDLHQTFQFSLTAHPKVHGPEGLSSRLKLSPATKKRLLPHLPSIQADRNFQRNNRASWRLQPSDISVPSHVKPCSGRAILSAVSSFTCARCTARQRCGGRLRKLSCSWCRRCVQPLCGLDTQFVRRFLIGQRLQLDSVFSKWHSCSQ